VVVPVVSPRVSPAVPAAPTFLGAFRAAHGRAPRVLHIGNIANNAYLNAKILNRHGYDCDVICADAYHIMGCPEWEEVDFKGVITDHFRPDWTAVDLGGYQRPRWFAQGPREYCIDYLIAKRTGQTARAERLWRDLAWFNGTLASTRAPGRAPITSWLAYIWTQLRFLHMRARARPDADDIARARVDAWRRARGWVASVVAPVFAGLMSSAVWLSKVMPGRRPAPPPQELVATWKQRFAEAFPSRPDQLEAEDLEVVSLGIHDWRRLFEQYDLVQAYATDVMLPMLAEKVPYLGFEHGTLRAFTVEPTPVNRLTALGYHRASHVFITNGDCLDYARRINVRSYTPMVHPFDDEQMRRVAGDREALRQAHEAEHVFLCPLRHDWEIKGTDKYIRALPSLVQLLGPTFKVIMTRWGSQVGESRRLAESLGVVDRIVWTEPLNRVQLIRHLKSVDVVFDQIALPCFGGTAPQAIASSVPVIMSYDPASTAWLIPEAAPILTAWTADEIASAVKTALDPAWRAHYEHHGRRWYEEFHSSGEVVAKHDAAYLKVCTEAGLLTVS
jgi:hypothetical protein